MIIGETVQVLIAGFESIGYATRVGRKAVENLTCAMAEIIIHFQIDKCIKYAERYINGTFVLRWIWKRKLEREFQHLTRLIDEYAPLLAETDIVEKLCDKK